ncbi:hypothetical protein HPB47_020756 [Ixodes persulcatus]|uniref:Uncharacterized protein n=1 Tax=Ixodes persulcatus TaxID=34615 RepID=A0AC60QFC8_IXOPE|nr:hypothetical protein HPB47_020756 [Ixodes persulcatus]
MDISISLTFGVEGTGTQAASTEAAAADVVPIIRGMESMLNQDNFDELGQIRAAKEDGREQAQGTPRPFQGITPPERLASFLALVLCRSEVPPSCTKVSLNPKKKEENKDLRTLATWWRQGGGEVQQEAVEFIKKNVRNHMKRRVLPEHFVHLSVVIVEQLKAKMRLRMTPSVVTSWQRFFAFHDMVSRQAFKELSEAASSF